MEVVVLECAKLSQHCLVTNQCAIDTTLACQYAALPYEHLLLRERSELIDAFRADNLVGHDHALVRKQAKKVSTGSLVAVDIVHKRAVDLTHHGPSSSQQLSVWIRRTR